ncbi:uncharacterized protein LOC117173374 [Belonocnema kinseyi]|uniref:uncharacterized protein LOC117173374 n=1 Tax=Belonocnema kinseyi TaxID=2817044 RepID=UPI00143D866D|nr:uncharacterized protein LOC117173374 [Belonocnema kinseyi]XP_033217786.1 uncharacterized protein LOC117173374 [Belonocnema kinseyi]
MKIHVGAPLLTLAIFFSLIELSSQYNKDILGPEDMSIPDYLDIVYTITDDLDVVAHDGHNKVVYGLMHVGATPAENRVVCALERDGEKFWARKLMVQGEQVTVDAANFYSWTDQDTKSYQIEFDKVIS